MELGVITSGHHLEPGTNGQGAELSRKWEENGYWTPEIDTCVTDLERFWKNNIVPRTVVSNNGWASKIHLIFHFKYQRLLLFVSLTNFVMV